MKSKEDLSLIHRHASWGIYYSEENSLVDWLSDSYDVKIYDWRQTNPNELVDGNIWLRCPTDYLKKRQEFMDWYRAIGNISKILINNPETVEVGLSKEYLLSLATSVPVVLSEIICNIDELNSYDFDNKNAILKPLYGESSHGVIKIDKKTSKKRILRHIQTHGPCLIQPFMEGIYDGEISLYYFNSTYTYAVRSMPMYHSQYKVSWQNVAQDTPDKKLIELSTQAFNQWPHRVDYARLDWIKDSGKYFLSEFEVIDPMLNIRWIDDKTRVNLLSAIKKMFI